MLIKQSTAAKALPFYMVDSTDHIAGKTGLTPTVTISKNGAAFAAPAGAITEIGNGWYRIAANATDSNTLGALLVHATATGADPYDCEHEVVLFDVDLATVVVATNNDKTGYALTAAYDPAKTAMQSGALVALTSAYDAAKTAAAPGAAMTLTSAYDPAKTAAQVGSAMTLTAAYDSAKTAATQASVTAVDDFVDTEVSAIKVVTDKLDTALELDGAVYRYTVNSLENAPAGGGGGTTDWTAPEREQIRHRLGIDGTATAPSTGNPSLPDAADISQINSKLDAIDDFVDTEIAAIKAKTDQLTFTGGKVDANAVTSIVAGDLIAIADGILKRDWTAVSGEAAYSLLNAARMLRNVWNTTGGTLSVKKEDGTTNAWTRTLSTDPAAEPITGAS